ncbi:RAB7A-interacting MON1-CCZ1 complex subunit 1-like isoform X2 [Acropora muricata]|uniref:RAB7A-interacting MON1-CCZ1 complex subunit 1-like isoform X2 n=1 Tax=Acropora muricata TaxID=159855 RepID=UPI0034E4372D
MAEKPKVDMKQRFTELLEECADIRKGIFDFAQLPLLEKAESKCKRCLSVCEKGQASTNKEMAMKIVQGYTEALLDVTYVVECQLVNEEFPEDRSAKEIKHLIGRLDQPETLVMEIFGSEVKPVEVLGVEMLECLSWRCGALFYMYCHTVFNDSKRKQLNTAHLLECAVSGVIYLQSMLSIRSPLVLEEYSNTDIKDPGAVNLLKEGVYSDTHLLALMYAGEMCYWHWKVSQNACTDNSSLQNRIKTSFDSLANGTKFLQKFVNVVRTQVRGNGWDFSKAEKILAEFAAQS